MLREEMFELNEYVDGNVRSERVALRGKLFCEKQYSNW